MIAIQQREIPMKVNVLSLLTEQHILTVFRDGIWEQLNQTYSVKSPDNDQAAEAILKECSAVLTGWGTNFEFTPERLRSAQNLKIIAHTAGTVKMFFPNPESREILLSRKITVFAGLEGMGRNVAEAAIGLLILTMRRWPQLIEETSAQREKRQSENPDRVQRNDQFLTKATVGLVGLSTVARMTIPLLKAFECHILAYDPFCSSEEAASLGVELVALNDLFRRSDAVSLHAPAVPSTRNMIGAEQLNLLREGAALINTARGMIIDHDALYEKCRTSRINVALDVTDPEPLPTDSPLFDLPNVTILPHVAGLGYAGLLQIGDQAFEAIGQAMAGNNVHGAIPIERWDFNA